MRKVTQAIVEAFLNKQPASSKNSRSDGQTLMLHGNPIARWTEAGHVEATLAGWPTTTTRERLNGLCELMELPGRFRQHRGRQYFNDARIEENSWLKLS